MIFCLIWGSAAAYAQDSTRAAQTDTMKYVLLPDLIRSAIVPGLGQIHQEKPGRAVIFYGLSVTFLYGTLHNWSRWHNTGNPEYLRPARTNLALFLQVYALNLLDVIDTYVNDTYQPWEGGLHSDVPLKSPWGAVARSAMLPGWGQFYNEAYIKGLVSLGVFSTFAYNVIRYAGKYSETGEKYFRDRRTVHSWYLGLTYLLVMVDAYVDANLYKFEEAMELTCTFSCTSTETTPMLGVRIVF